MPWALNQLRHVASAWRQPQVPPDWSTRYGLRSDRARLPKDASTREALARQIGADGFQLLEWGWPAAPTRGLHRRSALEALRRIWLQQYDRCTAPGWAALRWRTGAEQPPSAVRMASPYDLEARYSSKHHAHWVGYKLHLTETCDTGRPDLITPGLTTPATTPDSALGPTIHRDLARRELLPGTHLRDRGSVDADRLGTAQTQQRSAVMGPPFGPYSRPRLAGEGDDLHAFVLAWEAQQARCPRGHTRVHWRPGHDVAGDPVMRLRCAGATCRACPTRPLTVRPPAYQEAIQAARQRQATVGFKVPYALRAGVESRLSPGIRRVDRRRSRDLGLARPHLQQRLTATAMHMVRVIAWRWGEPLGERRRKPGHFARLAPPPLSRQTVLC
jgi:transposase